jgi:hypothetical protein
MVPSCTGSKFMLAAIAAALLTLVKKRAALAQIAADDEQTTACLICVTLRRPYLRSPDNSVRRLDNGA